MSDPLHIAQLSAGHPAQAMMASTALWPSLKEKTAKHKLTKGVLVSGHDIPAFCNPLVIFIGNWVLMLVTLSFQVTYVSYPNAELPALLLALSLGSFLLGYLVSRMLLRRWPTSTGSPAFSLDVTELWQLNVVFCGTSLLIIIFNWIFFGPPPALGDPASYLTYGRFKQVLFPLLVTVTVNATLDPLRWRKALFMFFGIAGLTIYVTRGLIMVAFLQMFFVFALRTRMSRRRLYTILVCFLAFAIVLITLIGNARTEHGVFLEYLQIRHKYADWPMAYLWFTSYVSIPFSNLCWMMSKADFRGPTLSFLYPLLPSFLMPADPHAAMHNDLTIIDGASTYLAAYALDFSYVGIYLANLILGIGSGWLKERAMPKSILVAGVLLTCLSFIFFSDMFTPLSTILQLAVQAVVQRRCFHWGGERVADMVPE